MQGKARMVLRCGYDAGLAEGESRRQAVPVFCKQSWSAKEQASDYAKGRKANVLDLVLREFACWETKVTGRTSA